MKVKEITLPIKLEVRVEEAYVTDSNKWVVVGMHPGAIPVVFGGFTTYDDADLKRLELQRAQKIPPYNDYYVVEVQE